MVQATWHRLSNIDPDAKLADCTVCGPLARIRVWTRSRPNGEKKLRTRCLESINLERRWRRARKKGIDLSTLPGQRQYRPCGSGETYEQYKRSPASYERLRADQEGRCPICLAECEKLLIDHDHVTGVVRGLLCAACNAALGCLHDDIAALQRAVAYLLKAAARPAA